MTELDNNTIQEENNTIVTEPADDTAGASVPEDTGGASNAWQAIAEDQRQTIDALTDHIKALDAQIAKLVNNGAQINDGRQVTPPAVQKTQYMDVTPANALPDDYVPLRDLGKLIGKKD